MHAMEDCFIFVTIDFEYLELTEFEFFFDDVSHNYRSILKYDLKRL